jgi:very-short-patch-repair endonuclease
MEVVVRTHGLPGYPSHYKLDIAHPERRIAIEVDGASHHSRKVQEKDLKKTRFLEARGWRVLRFWNLEVLEDLPTVMARIERELSSTTSRRSPATTSPTGCSSTTVTD